MEGSRQNQELSKRDRRVTPNQPMQRTRSGGLRPPTRAADGRRWTSQDEQWIGNPGTQLSKLCSE
jgi:hypothetical protein